MKRIPILHILIILTTCSLLLTTFGFTQDSKEEESLFISEKAFEDGFYDVALGLFERFLKNYPDSKKIAQVNLLIGQSYFHQNKFLEALAKFEELLK